MPVTFRWRPVPRESERAAGSHSASLFHELGETLCVTLVRGAHFVAVDPDNLPSVPGELRWLFPELRLEVLDVARDRDFILARVLERGRLVDVRWALRHYGDTSLHEFLRSCGPTQLSPRTLSFWRAYFHAEDEAWQAPPDFRLNNSVHWPV